MRELKETRRWSLSFRQFASKAGTWNLHSECDGLDSCKATARMWMWQPPDYLSARLSCANDGCLEILFGRSGPGVRRSEYM
jgi:hypothetical protein